MAGDMTPNEWERLEALIDRVLDAPPEQRTALIAELSGGDSVQRAELARLVSECEQAYPLLDRPVGERFATLLEDESMRAPELIAERYRIARELARGGMAIVYLARDIKHDRDVAVKIVRPEVVATLGRERFLREITIAAKLKHPHIVPLFDSGEVDGVLYYVMPYQEEQSLRARLRRDGRLPIDDTIAILHDVCDALAYAHRQGIVHRDIKPDNVLLSGRHAMVTDFGVARALTAASEHDTVTSAGVVVGTAAYMAPEQALGDAPIDHRVDIYAVGVMAYEMLAGERPFTGDTPPSERTAHSEKVSVDLTRLRNEVPPALAHVIMKCLETRTADRWQTADALLDSLAEAQLLPATKSARIAAASRRRWIIAALAAIVVTGAVAAVATESMRERRSRVSLSQSLLGIGILPVRAVTPTGDLDWLAAGLESRVSAELTEVSGLAVRPTETIAAHLANHLTLDSVARVTDVDYFVRATLSRSEGDFVVVTLELMEGGIRSVRVGSVKERPRPENVELIGRRVAEQLRPLLGSHVRERQLESSTTSSVALQRRRQADQHRLMARARLDKADLIGAQRSLDSARALLIESQQLDQSWTAPRLARAALSEFGVLLMLQQSGDQAANIRQAFDAGIAILDSVLKMSPNDAAALASRGRLRLRRVILGEPRALEAKEATAAAERDLRAAIKLDTTLARAPADLSHLLFENARYDDAADYAERAYRLDAYMEGAGTIISRLASSNFEIGRDAQATYWCAEGTRREPANPAHIACLLDVMAWGSGRAKPDSAWMHLRELESRFTSGNVSASAYYSVAVAAVLAKAPGVRRDSARAVVRRVLASVAASSTATQQLRDELLAFEAAVLFRLGDSVRANELFAQFKQRDPAKAQLLAQRRMLRDFVGKDNVPKPS